MYKHTQNDPKKKPKKLKEIKPIQNYIQVKKINAQSNISEYETEQSIQKNILNKSQKSKNKKKAKSVQNTHRNHLSSKKTFKAKNDRNNFSVVNKSTSGNGYNINDLNIYDYFSEKVVSTQKKFIDYKNNKINTLKNELSIVKKEINIYEKKSLYDGAVSKVNDSNNINSNQSTNNMPKNKSYLVPKIIYVNKKTNRYSLVNDNSYLPLSTFSINSIMFKNKNVADKNLEKRLSCLLTENNKENIFKNKINIKNNKINNENKKNMLSIIYQSKKGYYSHNNNNYEHNVCVNLINTVKNNSNNDAQEKINKNNLLEKEIKHNLYFFNNNIKENQIKLENEKEKINRENDDKIELKLRTINERINKIFNSFFDYYDKNNKNK